MKLETINTLITARTLFEKANEMCLVDDKFTASAGLIILQDAIELVFYACLVELDIDKEKSIEDFSFDQLIGELKAKGYKVQKSGNLKALNKQRVIIKHYGQVAEPSTVKNYYEAAQLSVNAAMKLIFGMDLHDIMVHEAIKNEDVKGFIATAAKHINDGKYFEALVEIRKALFMEIEEQYSVYDWKDYSRSTNFTLLDMFGKGGWSAPYHTKNKEWIDVNVKSPCDYIQIDHDKIRIDLLEWGVNTVDFWNLWRLTPRVFYEKETKTWRRDLDMKHILSGGTEENARYCLDRVVSLLIKKQNHFDLAKQLAYGPEYLFKVRMKEDQPLYRKASINSATEGMLKKDNIYNADAIVPGLDVDKPFVKILHIQEEEPKYQSGYVSRDACELIREQDK